MRPKSSSLASTRLAVFGGGRMLNMTPITPSPPSWRWKHYALGLFLCQGYRTTPLHRADYGWGHVTWNIGLEPPSLSQDNESATLRIWRGSAKRSGPKSLLRCVYT